MNIIVQGKQAREKWMRHELMCICYLKLEGLYIRLNWEFKLTTKISCMTQINMSSRWTARIKVEDREACFKRLRKRRLGGSKETDTGQRPEILESWRALCWRVSLFKWRRWLVNQGVEAKINTLESEGKCSPSTESEPNVPVNLTCWLTRRQSKR